MIFFFFCCAISEVSKRRLLEEVSCTLQRETNICSIYFKLIKKYANFNTNRTSIFTPSQPWLRKSMIKNIPPVITLYFFQNQISTPIENNANQNEINLNIIQWNMNLSINRNVTSGWLVIVWSEQWEQIHEQSRKLNPNS